MNTLRQSVSIHTALALAVLLAVAPALAIIVYSGAEQGRTAAREAREEAARQVLIFAEVQTRLTGSVEQLLSTLSALPMFRKGQVDAMDTILKSEHEANPEYLNLTVVDTDGVVVASSRLAAGVVLGERPHHSGAMKSGTFFAGEYFLNILDNRPTIAYSHPIFRADGSVLGAISATVTLDSFGTMYDSLTLPENALLGLVDRNGTRLFYYPERATNPIGGRIKADVWVRIVNGPDTGSLVDTGSDGIERYYAYRKLRLFPDAAPYMTVVYATPLGQVYRKAMSLTVRNVGIMGLAAGIAVLVAVSLSRGLFGARLQRIIDMAARMENGDLSARIGGNDNSTDLGRIARALDRMADTIEHRSAEKDAATAAVRASLAEKEVLLREIHHRVKNNLQLIMSLLVLQSAAREDAGTAAQSATDSTDPDSLSTLENRIRAMAMVHEMLYESDDLGHVDLGDYVRRLVQLGISGSGLHVSTDIQCDAIVCDLDKSVPFGLLFNELVTNAIKYASTGRTDGTLAVHLEKQPVSTALQDAYPDGSDNSGRRVNAMAVLTVRDDGPGLPPGFAIDDSSGLGLRLVDALSSQLGGELSWRTERGAVWELRFPLSADSAG